MKKNKKHKWKYQINIKKKILVTVILGVILFVGLGFAILESNLEIFGTLEVGKYDKTLYAALKREVGKGYALKYTGDHQDSMDPTKSTEDIYYWKGSTGSRILNRNNVVFAEKCWQMIRTTDTGGVKLLYNGDAETTVVDGVTKYDCGDTRNSYHMGEIFYTYNLIGFNKKYAKNYTISNNGTNTIFTLVDDPDDPNDTYTTSITSNNAATEIAYIVENYPYTCGSTSNACYVDSFYKVISQYSNDTADLGKVNTYRPTQRDNIGASSYNSVNSSLYSPAYVGYMYGDVYEYRNDLVATITQNLIETASTGLRSTSFSDKYKYSKTLNLTGTSTTYELDNPILGSAIPEDTYVGYYTYRSASTVSGTNPKYLVAKDGTGTYYYSVELSETKDLASFNVQIGTDIVDNGDNTYTIKNGANPSTEVAPLDWYNNYANYVGRYTCGDTSDTCQNPRYITGSTVTNYTYVTALDRITIAKSRNGLVLSDYITVRKDEWYSDYATYGEYKYTCGDDSTTCTESNLRYISAYTATNYTYSPNRYFGKSVRYENGVYKLQDIEELETAKDLAKLSTHHYACLNLGVKECSQVAYIYYYTGTSDKMYHINLNDSNVESVQDALDAMLKKNTTDSTIKTNIDRWYENNLLNTIYESKLDDTIYCNDRSFNTSPGSTFAESGWNDDGGSTKNYLKFRSSSRLDCINEEDKFSISNSRAQLTYKIGLISFPEMYLFMNSTARKTDWYYWLSSPNYFDNAQAYVRFTDNSGNLPNSPYMGNSIVNVNSSIGVRPAISLVSGTEYSSGDGSMTNPYIVDMSN